MYQIIEKLLFKIIEPILSLLEHLGLKEWIKNKAKGVGLWVATCMTTFTSLAYGAWLWFYTLVPIWALPLVIVAMFALALAVSLWIVKMTLRVIEQYIATRSRLSFDKAKYRELGHALLELYQDMARANVDWTAEAPIRDRSSPSPSLAWEAERHRDRVLGAKFTEPFAPRLHQALSNIAQLGIPLPFAVSVSGPRDIASIATYIGFIGQMLKSDQLDNARRLTRDDLWLVQ